MYCIFWRKASKVFNKPYKKNSYLDLRSLDYALNNCYQYHLYGKVTRIANNITPKVHTIYNELLHHLNISII